MVARALAWRKQASKLFGISLSVPVPKAGTGFHIHQMQRIIGPTQDYRVIQVHPLLKCNLRCAHCYSISGPDQVQSLPVSVLARALNILRAEGFNGMGVSGGEPLLYAELSQLLQHSRALGMLTTVTTNGMLLNAKRARMLKDGATLVAISLDGRPKSHNRTRGHPRAFEHMAAGVCHLKEAGVPFGFIFTLTLYNLDELGWIAEYAVDQGASLLQVHPLEEVGRAQNALPGAAPDNLELARAFVEIARLQQTFNKRLKIQFDVADKMVLLEEPERAYAAELCANTRENLQTMMLSDILTPLVIEADGSIVPLEYNFGRSYQIGNVHAVSLSEDIQAWKRDVFPQFLNLCRNVHSQLTRTNPSEFPFMNWYSQVLEESHHPHIPGLSESAGRSQATVPNGLMAK
jgi:Fe-coproporphyrin III synthase